MYCVLPRERTSASPSLADAARAGAHIDPEPMHMVATAYVDKVPKDGGGIALFPGSHRLLYEAEPDSVDLACYSILHSPHPESGAAAFVLPQPQGLKDALADIEPFEFFGDEGDVVLWHGRMFHSATPNYSSPPQIRQMILYDACKKSMYDRTYNGRYVKGPRPSPPPNVRKLHGLELELTAPPPEPRPEGPGLWDDWSEAVRTIAASKA
jgi:ectoine hydroxylase-related dioxygenase (phytanoyl-CoA dioxygenase family)